ncbi:unnamed protein product [Peniophora sp. CBMAI 1063]|nr:unnamed protein product [Peniophora sp. CBMAI 1063]
MSSEAVPNAPGAKFRVAVVGGGPGGMALAMAISKFNNPAAPVVVDVYESQPAIGTVGAGISVWPRTRALLQHLGLMRHFQGELNAQNAQNVGENVGRGFLYSKSDQPHGYPLYHMPMSCNPMLLHRSDFLRALQSDITTPPLCNIHTSKRLVALTQDAAGEVVTMRFADGATAQADAVIGADGVRSVVRANMLSDEERIEPEWPGVIAYRTLVPKEVLEAKGFPSDHDVRTLAHAYCGKGRHLVTYPISRGDFVNVVAFVSHADHSERFEGKWVRDVSVEEVRDAYKGWEPDVEKFLQCIETASAWAIHIVRDIPRASRGRIAVLGDAMHAFEPHFGAGAGQAMEDAYILARLLTHRLTTRASLPLALDAYNQSRLAFSTHIVRRTRLCDQLYEFSEGPLPSGPEDKDGIEKWSSEVHKLWEFQLDEHGADDFWRDAEIFLQGRMGESMVRASL